jgi:DNA-directed RNA polymerase subunit RPC12/RpoP
MPYKCVNCGKEIKQLENFVRCRYCESRILLKSRPNIAKEITTD